jgi:hypothetical protein
MAEPTPEVGAVGISAPEASIKLGAVSLANAVSVALASLE